MTTAGEVDTAAAGEELEPLFDYKRVQPTIKFRFDDSDLEKADIFKCNNKRPRVNATKAKEVEGKPDEKAAEAKVVVIDEEDWLQPPPPKAASRAPAEEDSAFRELRLKKQEWAKFAESAQDILQELDKTTKKEVGPKEPPVQIILDEEPEPQVEKIREKIKKGRTQCRRLPHWRGLGKGFQRQACSRTNVRRLGLEKIGEKIVIKIQDKDGEQQIRVYKDEKFDKLLKVYAKKAKLNPSDLTFVFDGEKINLSSTPQDLDLEDDEIIEVRHKGCRSHP